MGDFVDDVRQAAVALSGLLGQASDLVASAHAKVRDATDDMESALSRGEVAVLVVGAPDGGKRALMNAICGERLFRSDASEPAGATIVLRRGEQASYVARLRDGRVVDFAKAMRDREDSFEKARARAESDRDAAEKEIAEAKQLLAREPPPLPAPEKKPVKREEKKEETKPPDQRVRELTIAARHAPPWRRAWLALRAFFVWLVAYVGSFAKSAKPKLAAAAQAAVRALPAPAPKVSPAQRLAEAQAKLETARAQLARVAEERGKYADERRRELLTDVRSFSDGGRRGADLVELVVEYPTVHLPEKVVVLDVPDLLKSDARGAAWAKVRDQVATCVVVAPSGDARAVIGDDLAKTIHPIVPRIVGGAAGIDEEAFAARLDKDAPALVHRAREDWPRVVAARAVAEMLVQVHEAGEASAKLEAKSRAHVAELEKQRLPEPKAFRQQLLERMTNAIARSAHDVTKKSVELLRRRTAAVRDEWIAAIEACKDRGEIEACVKTMNETAPKRLGELLEKIGDEVLAEMQRASEALQAFALEEMRSQYKSRKMYDDQAAALIVEMPDDVAALANVPLGNALVSFEKRRVGIGLGGAAAGAALGTAIFPGIGTAIGAFVGVFAGFIEGTASLKKDCIDKIQMHVNDVEKQVSEKLGAGASDLARDLRVSVQETLEQSLGRREESILRMIDLEAKTLEREKKKLMETTLLRAALTEQENKLSALAQAANEALRS